MSQKGVQELVEELKAQEVNVVVVKCDMQIDHRSRE